MPMTAFHPGLGSDINYEFHSVPEDPDGQVEAVIGIMRRYVEEDSKTPPVQAQAQAAYIEGRGDPVAGVFGVVKRQLEFHTDEEISLPFQGRMDSPIVEALIRPVDMATSIGNGVRIGDCDDYAMYAAALLTSLGVPCAFVTIAADAREPERYSHVYVAAYPKDGRGRVAMDTSHGEYVGWECEKWTRRAEWPIGAENRLRVWAGIAAVVAGMWWAGRKGWLN